MKFYFPDAQDVIYPGYDFERDEYPPHRVRQRDDRYAHEVLDPAPYDGMLISKAVIDGSSAYSGKYSQSQRDRLYRHGARRFFRLKPEMGLLGDNGAFSYVKEHAPPVTVSEVLDFYETCGCDAGVSIDHLITAFEPQATLLDADPEWARRRRLSLDLAAEFMAEIESRHSPVEPLGAAQGWSEASYADSVTELQGMGYEHIALGGLVPLKTNAILQVLSAVSEVLHPETKLHILGVARPEAMDRFADLGVTSFDSTSPFRQAFMDDRKNYHTKDDAYVAIRIPQLEGNAKLKRRILSGQVNQQDALVLERACLRALRDYDAGKTDAETALMLVGQYESLTEPTRKSYLSYYERTLREQPWKQCSCSICRKHGIEVVIFRGTERNKRRGFHNIGVLSRKIPDRPRRPAQGGTDD